MMEEIDRFQVPPVNGETQPLVRDNEQKHLIPNANLWIFFLFASVVRLL